MDMASIPLYIHSPVSESVMQALPYIEESRAFSFHNLRVDPELFPLLLDVRPCVAIFSIPGPEHTRAVCSLLESFRLYRTAQGYSQRDPTLRIVLVAEQRAVGIERWHELGVHEFIIAPILPRALAFKVSRHHQRAIVSHIPEPVLEQEEEVIVIRGGVGGSGEIQPPSSYTIVNTSFRPTLDDDEGMRFQAPSGATPPKKISILASIPELKENEGQWTPSLESPPSRASTTDKKWNWSWFPPKDREMKQKWTHHGDRPSYDKKRAGWNLSGENPELTMKDEKGISRKLLSTESKPDPKGGPDEVPEIIVDEQLDVHEVSGQNYKPKPAGPARTSALSREASSKSGKPGKPSREPREESPSSEPDTRSEEKPKSATTTEPPSNSGQERPYGRIQLGPNKTRESAKRQASESNREAQKSYGTRAGSQEPPHPFGRGKTQADESDSADAELSEPEQDLEVLDSDIPPGTQNDGPDDLPDSVEDEKEPRLGSPLDHTQRQSLGSRIKRIVLKDIDEDSESVKEETLMARLDAALQEKAPETKPSLSDAPQKERKEADFSDLDRMLSTEPEPIDPMNDLTTPTEPSEEDRRRTSFSQEDQKDPLSLRSLGETRYHPSADRELRLDPEKQSKELKLKSSSSSEKQTAGDLKLKSGSGEANTWSMQNLDDPEGLHHKKTESKSGELDLEAELKARIPDGPMNAADAQAILEAAAPLVSTMSPSERERLLKKVYESLKIGEPATADAGEAKDENGFFSRVLKRVLSYLKIGAD